jgi:hypothetical protein
MYCHKFLISILPALAVLLISACGGGGGGSATPVAPLANNVLPVVVDNGPANTGYNANRLYASIKICGPGTTVCQTIDHVLVDTGSTGLRLLASALAPALRLPQVTAESGLPLLNCVKFVDNSFAWGPVAMADITLGGITAASVPIQVIADPAFNSLASNCSVGGTPLTTATTLGANGILGLGVFKEDCGAMCAEITANKVYYSCADASCSTTAGTKVALAQQIKNPVPLFPTDNNGLLIDLPAVTATTASRLSGSLIFGVGTQPNNQPVGATLLGTSNVGLITTVFAGQSLGDSFIDSGSNGLYFDLASVRACTAAATGFYCPLSRVNLTASIVAANVALIPVSFTVDDALSLFATGHSVLPTLAGDIGMSQTFDWGLPFFYGRRIFVGIEGRVSSLATGPFYAF